MSSLTKISGVGNAALKLLDAVGISNADDLAAGADDPDAFYQQLGEANRKAKAFKRLPSPHIISSWIEDARELVGGNGGDPPADDSGESHHHAKPNEKVPQSVIAAETDRDPARPPTQTRPESDHDLPADPPPPEREDQSHDGAPPRSEQPGGATQPEPHPMMKTAMKQHLREEREIPVRQLSEAEFTRQADDAPEAAELFDVRGNPVFTGKSADPAAPGSKKIDFDRMHTFDDVREGRIEIKPLTDDDADVPAQPTPIQTRQLQRLEPKQDGSVSRWIRRGIDHPHPVRLYFAMVFVLISRILFFVVVIGTPLVLAIYWTTGREYIYQFLPAIIAFFFFGLIHVVIAARVRCKVCHGSLLLSKRCHKNNKAHRRFPLGYSGSTAMHAVIFKWFRCMYCGTPIQLGRGKSRHHPHH